MPIFLLVALLHPVHETVAEVEWDADKNHLEVALRLDALDEQWLKRQSKGSGDVQSWALPYVRNAIRIAERPKKDELDACRYRWVGRQAEGAHVWWYFEIKPNDKKRPRWLEQSMFLERNENFKNRVLILGQRRSLIMNSKNRRSSFDAAADSPAETSPDNQNDRNDEPAASQTATDR
ncbi:MAG: DUF6702 family protein [Rubripirellula sp.]